MAAGGDFVIAWQSAGQNGERLLQLRSLPGCTSYDAFAASTPVVTLPDAFQRSRYTAALYDRMGIRTCVARSAAEYIEMAFAIGTDRAYRAEISAQIAAACPALFDDLTIVSELTEAFQTIANA